MVKSCSPFTRRDFLPEEELSPACVAWKKELQQDLEFIKRVCDFAVHRIYKHFANPGLEIGGCLIRLPLTPLFTNQIKAVTKPASFSRHGSNVEDYSASLIWQLDHDQFHIANPSWSAFVESIKQDVAQGLGLALSDIDFEPDKLALNLHLDFYPFWEISKTDHSSARPSRL